jgi:hypothetical protein
MRKKLLIGVKRIGCELSYSGNINFNESEKRKNCEPEMRFKRRNSFQ